MLKYLISIAGGHPFSMEITPLMRKTKKGEEIDYSASFTHVKEIVGPLSTVELAH